MIDKITVRQIAEQAGAGIGSINYYFGSRDKLLSIAIGNILAETANQYIDQKDTSGLEPVERLKNMLKDILGAEKDEIELRIIALQLLQPLQMAGISPEAFRMYCGIVFFCSQPWPADLLADKL